MIEGWRWQVGRLYGLQEGRLLGWCFLGFGAGFATDCGQFCLAIEDAGDSGIS